MTQGSEEFQVIRLQRADQAADLWSAIEAAQYGRILHQEDAEKADDPAPLGTFLGLLSEVVEVWEEVTPESQIALLQKLDAPLSALQRLGHQVHWGLIRRTVGLAGGGAVEIPLAVFRVSRDLDTSLEVALPSNLTAWHHGQ